jgi:thiamine biosynthesis lipoprotein
VLVLPVVLSMTGCARSDHPESLAAGLVDASRLAMGSEVHLTAWTTDRASAPAAFEAVFQEFERLEALMSVWRDGSDIVRLNEAAGRAPVRVSPEVMDALQAAFEAGTQTSGAFDVTFGALSGLWKFDHDQDNRIPARAAVLARLPLVDYRRLELDAAAGTAHLTRPGMRAHLGGIGKGYAVDRAASILRARGLRDFMIQAGGDLYVSGTRGDRPWRLGIRDPRGPAGASFAALDLADAAFSTSGDYERYFMQNGRRYHHIIDPRTGEPARGSRSVTITAKTATVADALSTGVFVLGPEAGMALVERLADVDAVIVDEENRVLVSSGLKGRLALLRQPGDEP